MIKNNNNNDNDDGDTRDRDGEFGEIVNNERKREELRLIRRRKVEHESERDSCCCPCRQWVYSYFKTVSFFQNNHY